MEKLLELVHQRTYDLTVENVSLKMVIDDIQTPSTINIGNDLHMHSYAELFVCFEGEIVVLIKDGYIRLAAGDAAIIPTQMYHRKLESALPEKWESFGFSVSRHYNRGGSNLYQWLEQLFSSNAPILLPGQPEILKHAGDLSRQPNNVTSLPAIRLTLILAEIAEKLYDPSHTAGTICLNELTRDAQLDYLINECFAQPLSVENTAKQLYISSRTLERLTMKRYGTTFQHAILGKRMTAAAFLLEHSNDSIEQIGYKVGYNSKYSFHRVFSNYFGVTPAHYREAAQNPTGQ